MSVDRVVPDEKTGTLSRTVMHRGTVGEDSACGALASSEQREISWTTADDASLLDALADESRTSTADAADADWAAQANQAGLVSLEGTLHVLDADGVAALQGEQNPNPGRRRRRRIRRSRARCPRVAFGACGRRLRDARRPGGDGLFDSLGRLFRHDASQMVSRRLGGPRRGEGDHRRFFGQDVVAFRYERSPGRAEDERIRRPRIVGRHVRGRCGTAPPARPRSNRTGMQRFRIAGVRSFARRGE